MMTIEIELMCPHCGLPCYGEYVVDHEGTITPVTVVKPGDGEIDCPDCAWSDEQRAEMEDEAHELAYEEWRDSGAPIYCSRADYITDSFHYSGGKAWD